MLTTINSSCKWNGAIFLTNCLLVCSGEFQLGNSLGCGSCMTPLFVDIASQLCLETNQLHCHLHHFSINHLKSDLAGSASKCLTEITGYMANASRWSKVLKAYFSSYFMLLACTLIFTVNLICYTTIYDQSVKVTWYCGNWNWGWSVQLQYRTV